MLWDYLLSHWYHHLGPSPDLFKSLYIKTWKFHYSEFLSLYFQDRIWQWGKKVMGKWKDKQEVKLLFSEVVSARYKDILKFHRHFYGYIWAPFIWCCRLKYLMGVFSKIFENYIIFGVVVIQAEIFQSSSMTWRLLLPWFFLIQAFIYFLRTWFFLSYASYILVRFSVTSFSLL